MKAALTAVNEKKKGSFVAYKFSMSKANAVFGSINENLASG